MLSARRELLDLRENSYFCESAARLTLDGINMFRTALRTIGILVVALTLACCARQPIRAYVGYRGQRATVAAIELAWGDGRAMGSFVDSTASSVAENGTPLVYRIHIVFDDGYRATITQDASIQLHVGERVVVEAGRLQPSTSEKKGPFITPGPF